MNETLYIGLGYIGAGLGAGLTIIGAGLGIGKATAAAAEGTARQPEAVNPIRVTMIIGSALIEGVAFFALAICLFGALNLSKPKTAEPAHAPVAAEAAPVAK
ncbi:MAG: ATP synthase F0 subunit C [Elusimicrobiaceae bacterium]|nr:ATP synthase F0 subunit C [Elusimicrobiaceae bacterium]